MGRAESDIRMAGQASGRPAGGRSRISPIGQFFRGLVLFGTVAGVLAYAYVPAREFQRRVDCCENLKMFHAGRATFESIRCPRSGRGYERLDDRGVEIPFPHIVAYEPLENHGGDGGAILFSDGHAEFLMKGSYLSRMASDHKSVTDYLKTQAESGPTSDRESRTP